MNEHVKIALMGAGVIGKRHIDIINQNHEVEISAIVDPVEAAGDYAASINVPWFRTIGELLASQRPDGIIVATPNQYHVANGLEAIEAKIPILMEKPIADNVDEALTLVEASEKNNVALIVGHHRRHNPMLQTAKHIIESGRLGTVLAAHCMFWIMKPDSYFSAAWRREKGAGPVFVNMIHDVDCLRYLFGDVASVQATETTRIRGFENEESCGAILRFKNGVIATFTVSDSICAPWSWDMTAQENPAFPQVKENAHFIGGTHGSLALPSLELWNYRGERSWAENLQQENNHIARIDPLILQLQNFRDVILGRAEPLVSGRDGLETLRATFAVKEAARTGQTIHLHS